MSDRPALHRLSIAASRRSGSLTGI